MYVANTTKTNYCRSNNNSLYNHPPHNGVVINFHPQRKKMDDNTAFINAYRLGTTIYNHQSKQSDQMSLLCAMTGLRNVL